MREWIDGLNLVGAIAFFWAVGVIRTSIVFALGWLAASGGRRWTCVRSAFDHPVYLKAQNLVNRWGVLAVPACFLTVGLQTAVIMTTGFTKMPLARWIPAMLLGTLIWGTIYGTVGIAVVWAWLERPWIATPILLVAFIAFTVLFIRHSHRKNLNAQTNNHVSHRAYDATQPEKK